MVEKGGRKIKLVAVAGSAEQAQILYTQSQRDERSAVRRKLEGCKLFAGKLAMI